MGTPITWAALHLREWERQEAIFLETHKNGEHADAIATYEKHVDVKWSPFNLKLSNKALIVYAMPAAESYDGLGMTEQAQQHYLRVIGWNQQQYQAYCALNTDCNARTIAMHNDQPG